MNKIYFFAGTLIILSAMCMPLKASAANCTLALGANNPKTLSSTAGLWTGTGCTGAGFIPGNGDVVADITGTGTSALTIDQPWTIGTSPSDSTTFVFIHHVPLVVNSALTMKGNMGAGSAAGGANCTGKLNCANSTWNAGSSLTFDPTGAATSTAAAYVYRQEDSSGGVMTLTVNGTSGSPVTFQTNVSGCASCVYASFPSTGVTWNASYLNVSKIGTSTGSTAAIMVRPGTGQTATLSHIALDSSGSLYLYNGSGGSVVASYITTTNSLPASNGSLMIRGDGSSGTLTLSRIVMDKAPSSISMSNTTLSDSYLPNFSVTGIRNLYPFRGLANMGMRIGDQDNYILMDTTSPNNPHLAGTGESNSGLVGSGTIFDIPDNAVVDTGENYDINHQPVASTTISFKNSISLPSKTGVNNNQFFWINGASSNYRVIVDHNTAMTDMPLIPTYGGIVADETTANPVGQYLSVQSNIFWANTQRGNVKLRGMNTTFPTQDVCVTCDYNAGYNMTATFTGTGSGNLTNQGNGYASKWTTTPGTHDIDVVAGGTGTAAGNAAANPHFADTFRNVALWDTKYLGNTAPQGAWQSGISYNLGDIVSDSNAGVYGGLTVNYRAIATHISDSSTEPNVGANWRNDWEFASLYSIRQAISVGTTYTDGAISCISCSPTQALGNWVKAGYRPQNPKLWQSGHDGKSIGAVDMSTLGPAMVGAISY